ncbi:MAG: nitroreductase [Clostridiales bacterium]|nr:nitroreductase [Clostridiales bacterium]
MSFMELAKERYSVRSFSDRAVEQEKLEKIIEAGMIAPTAKNLQPVRIYVMKSADAMEKMNALTRCIYGAPAALLVCYNEDEAWHSPFNEGYDSGEMDASIILTHMMLEAWEQGIGSCWVGLFDHDEAARVFDLPAEVKPVAIMPLGYAAEGCKPAPMHANTRDRSELVTEL